MSAAAPPTEYELAAVEQMKDKPAAQALDSIGARLLGEFRQAKLDRKQTEERWMQDLRQYRGKYDPEELEAMGAARSKTFVRKTRVKVKTINSRVADLLFPAGSEKNWSIDSTPVPSLSPETLAEIQQNLLAQLQAQGQQQAQVTEEMVKAAAKEMAKAAAKGMSDTVEDQLTESHYKRASIEAIHSGHLYGTGVLKGPLVERRIRTKFVEEVKEIDGKRVKRWVMKNESYVVPFVECTPLWNWYPDMASVKLQTCRYVWELHRMTKADVADLGKRKTFNKQRIVDHLKANPKGSTCEEYFDIELKSIGDRDSRQADNRDQYDVLERWGYLDGEELKEIGVVVPDARLHESFFANIWLLPNGTVIKAALQPINGVTWPYHLYYFDKDNTSIFGEGLASVMRDDQSLLNAATRMMVDNGAMTSGPVLEINLDLLANTDKAEEVHPWKTFLRKSGKDAGIAAVRAVQIPNNLEAMAKMAQVFENNADETTAIPRYMSGENATQGAAGTAAGMSMLMAAANIVIKDLITAWDEGITRPFLEALYRWNMQFNADASIKGDFDVKARGTASLVAKEIRAQQLDMFAASTANAMDAPFIKRDKMLRQRAEAHELSDVVKTEDEVLQEQQSEQAQAQAKLQADLAAAQVAEMQARAGKLVADAELLKKKVETEVANIDLVIAQTIETRVAAMFAALQAGGVATNSPYIAPAGDVVYRGAGGNDFDGDPGLAQLNTVPVQAAPGTQQLLNKGQTFAEQPRGGQPTTVEPGVGSPQQAAAPGEPTPQPATGQVGMRAGVETVRIEP